jgi:ABC-type dipeptide/oligopeptide/nickel transport system permease subunit
MIDDDKTLEQIILTRLVRLNAKIHGLVTGTVFGVGLFLATNWLVLKGGKAVGRHLSLLSQFFIGYRVSFLGSLIGFAYAFACGFILGYSIAWMYNWFADKKNPKGRKEA